MLALMLSGPGLHTLDVGCGNNSLVTTKRWFPGSHYSGADIQRYNLNDQDIAAMDTFYLLDPDGEDIPRCPTKLIRLHSSSPCWVAYAKSGSDLL
jgi:hypothetical protein